MNFKRLLGLLGVLLCFAAPSLGCTSFYLHGGGHALFGKNLDWMVEDGLLVVNQRNVVKTSMGGSKPFQWKSEYGSFSFNQYGRELPMGGMNEAGLIVECLWLEATEYPPTDQRAGLSELQWVQYQLDTARTVEDVIASDSVVRIQPNAAAPLHFLVCDPQGSCATIEYLRGERVVHTGSSLPAPALTNDAYGDSLKLLEHSGGKPCNEAFQSASYSQKRFCWAARAAENFAARTSQDAVAYTFNVLDQVWVPQTQWSIVYDQANRRIFFKTQSNPAIRHLDTSAFELECGSDIKVLDLRAPHRGDVTRDFVDYTFEANLGLIQRTFSQTDFLSEIPLERLHALARYPCSLSCAR